MEIFSPSILLKWKIENSWKIAVVEGKIVSLGKTVCMGIIRLGKLLFLILVYSGDCGDGKIYMKHRYSEWDIVQQTILLFNI